MTCGGKAVNSQHLGRVVALAWRGVIALLGGLAASSGAPRTGPKSGSEPPCEPLGAAVLGGRWLRWLEPLSCLPLFQRIPGSIVMNLRILRALLLPTLAAAVLPAQDPKLTAEEAQLRQAVAVLEGKLVDTRAAGLRAVKVNGVELTPQHVRREAIFIVGAKMVEAKIAEFFIEEWMEQQISEGRDPADFEISEQKVIEELQGHVDEFRQKNPGVEFWEAVRSLTGLSKDGYMKQRRKTQLFHKVFFPGPASKWPDITKEAIIASAAGDNGQQFWENIEKSSIDPETGKERELPAFWMQLCQGWVQKQLKQWSDIRYPSDGLPAGIVLSVNGRTWETDAAFEVVRPGLFLQDIERGMTELVVREALMQELKKQGAYLTDEQFRDAFNEFRQEYDNTPFTTEVIATAFKGYPSLEAYRQRWRLLRSFENMIAKDINNDNLRAHGTKFARFFSDGQTSVDVIQFMGRDVKTGAWLADGMDGAKQRATEAYEAIKGGASFDDVLDKRGEFYVTEEHKGRLGSKSLNQLRQALRENEFSDVLLGYSVGTHLFYNAEPGTIVGPLRGPEAYYVARVNARTPARGTVSVEDTRQRELVKQDYVTYRFLEWSNDVLANATIE